MPEVACEFHRKAEACRRLADLSPEPERKTHWLKQADEWSTRAVREEKEELRRKRHQRA
jgi:hypothetical protein